MAKSGLSKLSYTEIQRELRRRERRVGALDKKRQKYLDKASAIEAQIREMGGVVHGGSGRKRAKNDSNLVDALVKVLTNKTMSVTGVSKAVQEAGYVTTSPNFRTIVNQALIRDKRFKRVDRGQYTAKA